jgi:hypothetical protein
MAENDKLPETDDGLTPAEREYMDTKGTSGLPETAPEAPIVATEEVVGDGEDEEPDTPDTPPPPGGKKPPRHVNYNKYRKLEEQYEKTQAELARLSDVSTRADERLKLINEALSAPAQEQVQEAEEEDTRPDPTEDIFAYVAWQERQMGRLAQALQQQNEEFTGIQQHLTTQGAQEQLLNNYRSDAMRYAQSQPAFGRAYQHLLDARGRQLEAGGIRDPRRRNEIITAEERDLVEAAYREQVNPAQRIWDLAQAYGFSPTAQSAQAPAAAAPATGRPAGQTAPGATPANVGAEIEAVRRGQAASLSLSQAGGAPPGAMTPEILADMTEEEFGRYIESLPKDKLRQLLPGA